MSWPFLNSRFLNSANIEGNSASSQFQTADRGSAGSEPASAGGTRTARPSEDARRDPAFQPARRLRALSQATGVPSPWGLAARTAVHGRQPARQDVVRRRRGGPITRPAATPIGGTAIASIARPWAIVGADTGELVRNGPQRVLCGRAGDPEAWGTGMLPRDALIDSTSARGTSDLLDTVKVRHVSGGTSTIRFKAYMQGRKAWQSDTADWVWFRRRAAARRVHGRPDPPPTSCKAPSG